VLVSWSHRANSTPGRELGVRMLRPAGTTGSYTIAGAGAVKVVTPGGINTFYERIATNGGDVLGLRVGNTPGGLDLDGGGAACYFAGAPTDSVRFGLLPDEPVVGGNTTLAGVLANQRLNVTARLEPDADGDGFGDETQDACPGVAGESGCPTPTTPGSPQDTTPPAARRTSRRDSIRDGRVAVWVTANEAATVTARGTLRIGWQSAAHRLRSALAQVSAAKRERMLLRLRRKTRRAARRALRRGRNLRVEVTVTLRDAAGNTGTARRSVHLKR
jgi:hypothetical protein